MPANGEGRGFPSPRKAGIASEFLQQSYSGKNTFSPNANPGWLVCQTLFYYGIKDKKRFDPSVSGAIYSGNI
jgi:hypothetical protein